MRRFPATAALLALPTLALVAAAAVYLFAAAAAPARISAASSGRTAGRSPGPWYSWFRGCGVPPPTGTAGSTCRRAGNRNGCGLPIPRSCRARARRAPTGPALVRLTPDDGETISIHFVGDAMFGRRFYDRNEDGNTSDGLLRPGAGPREHHDLLRPVQPLLENAHLTV
jgi:hypothetical protein